MQPLCARCRAPMVLTRLGQADAYGCQQCRGAFLSPEHAARIRAGVDRLAPVQAEQAAAGAPRVDPIHDKGQLPCPMCNRPMVAEWIAAKCVRIDACAAHGVFFDAHELAAIVPAEQRPAVVESRSGLGSAAEIGLVILFEAFFD